MAKYYMTKKEFCEAICTSPDNWLFENEKEHPIIFYKEIIDGETIYHAKQGFEHRRFKDMPQYGEIWMQLETPTYTSLYNMWTMY